MFEFILSNAIYKNIDKIGCNNIVLLMKVSLIQIGKTDDSYIKEGIDNYIKRIKFYHPFDNIIIPDLKKTKNLSVNQQKKIEGEVLIKHLQKFDRVVLLDENGKHYTSVKLASYFEKLIINSTRNLAFVIGGPYGFSEEIYLKYKERLALSYLTFSHQLVRLLFMEQLYRINTIIKREPYHHK